MRDALLLEARAIFAGRTDRLTRMHLSDTRAELQAAEAGIVVAVRAQFPAPPPVRLRRSRRFGHREMARYDSAYDVFEQDFLHEDLLIDGAVLRQVVLLAPWFGPTVAAGARAALPKWSRDLSTTGVLERIIESVPCAPP